MFDKALIDGDIVVYRCAAATEKETEGIACWQAGEMMRRILHETNSISHRCFLTGSGNFRYSVYPDYKANRRDMQKPKHWAAVREYLCTDWGAVVTDGHEADDAMGMEQDDTSVICSIDKDMLMIPGWHYNFVKQIQRFVTPLEGMRHFYYQMIMGDKTDNIPGYDGKMRDKVPKFLAPYMSELFQLTEEKDMYNLVLSMSGDEEKMIMCGKCLWIWRKDNDVWVAPSERLDNREDESFHYLDASSGLTEVAPEVRDSEGSASREEG